MKTSVLMACLVAVALVFVSLADFSKAEEFPPSPYFAPATFAEAAEEQRGCVEKWKKGCGVSVHCCDKTYRCSCASGGQGCKCVRDY